MPNITLSVDEDTIKKVRKIAVDKNTTLTSMVRDYLKLVVVQEDQQKATALKRLRDSFQAASRKMGQREWQRDMLYER